MARCAFSDTAAARFLTLIPTGVGHLIACLCGSADDPPAVMPPTIMPSASSGDVMLKQRQTDRVPLIFLSHSGKQKAFVKRLNDSLVNAGHYPFLDEHSIPKGVPFPEIIKQAASQCKLGVVILSNDFMISKWPMIELDILTKSSAVIIPVFYKLRPDDVKSTTNLYWWRKGWEEMTENNKPINISGWVKAVKSLAFLAGDVYRPELSEGEYIKKIVTSICKSFPPPVLYDVSFVKGQDRWIREVEMRFKHAHLACKSVLGVPAIGMHGVSGVGKTTLCRSMANFHMPSYAGKSAVMEFPFMEDMVSVVNQCKKILQQLTRADEKLLEQVDCFDHAVQLMKVRMKDHVVFLAVDNVFKHSSEQARRILEAGFRPGSKVLVTSRSEIRVLKKLLKGCDETCVKPVPSVNKTEALEIILEASFGASLSLASAERVDRALSSCFFTGCYQPSALKALGRRLRRVMDANTRRISLRVE